MSRTTHKPASRSAAAIRKLRRGPCPTSSSGRSAEPLVFVTPLPGLAGSASCRDGLILEAKHHAEHCAARLQEFRDRGYRNGEAKSFEALAQLRRESVRHDDSADVGNVARESRRIGIADHDAPLSRHAVFDGAARRGVE